MGTGDAGKKRGGEMDKKLFRLVFFLCNLGLNSLFAPGAFGHLGMTLDDLRKTGSGLPSCMV